MDKTKDIFLFIASKEKLSIPYVFEQLGLGAFYGKVIDSIDEWEHRKRHRAVFSEDTTLEEPTTINWIVKRIEIELTRN